MVRKLSSIVIVFFLLLNATTAANSALSEKQILDLKAFSVLEGDINGDLRLDENITRAEFTKAVCRILGYSDDGYFSNVGFRDVEDDYWAYSFISIAASLQLINGDGAGNFYPENSITYNQAVKILVTALGFGEEAVKAGGYPEGYLNYANNLGLLRGVSYGGDNVIPRGDAFKMIYNSLDADRLEVLSFGTDMRIGLADKSLREVLMDDQNLGLIKFRGIVTANYKTYLADPITNMKKDEVEVGGSVFNKGNTNADEYLGMETDVYIAREARNSDIYIIKEIRPTANNYKEYISFEDIETIDKSKIRYIMADAVRITEKSLETAQFVYNGRLVSDISDIDFSSMQDGKITLVLDRNTDNARFIFIDEYESFIVDRVVSLDENDVNVFFANNKTLRGNRNILLGKEHSVTYEIYDNNNKPVLYDAIRKGDLISVFYSMDRQLVKIMLSDRASSGILSSVSYEENKLSIDDAEYYFEKDLDVFKFMGKSISARVNFEGKVSYIDLQDSTSSFAGIVRIMQVAKLGSPYQVLLVLPNLLSDEVEESDDEYTENKIPAISGKNLKTLALYLASNVSYNGSRYSAAQAVSLIESQMLLNNKNFLAISYGIDANGNISRIDLPEIYKQGNDRTYNAYEKTFSDGKYNPSAPAVFGAFGLNDKTLAICVPSNAGNVELEDYLAKVEMNNGQDYYVEAYGYNKETNCPDFVLIYAPMVYRSVGITDGRSNVALVNKVSYVVRDENLSATRINMITQEGEREVFVSVNTTSSADFDSIKTGDLIRYSMDSRDELDGFELLQSTFPVPDTYYSSSNTDKVIFVGNISSVRYDEVSPGLNRWVHLAEIRDDYGNMVEYQLSKTSSPPIFIYDAGKRSARLGTSDDLVLTHQRAVIYSSGLLRGVTNVKAVVIIV